MRPPKGASRAPAPNSRAKVNVVNFLVSCAILFLAVRLSDGTFATKIHEISENLDKALHDVMDGGGDVQYTEVETNFTGVKSVSFNPRGMAGLYNFTNKFIDLIITRDFSFDGLLIVKNGNIRLGDVKSQWQRVLSRYAGLVAVCCVLILCIVFMPVCGLCFCCCRCCGNCGARSQESDKRHDLCRKIIFATLLIGLGTILLFVVVCAFVSNQQLNSGVNELPDNVNNSLQGVKSFMTFTTEQFRVILIQNFGEFATNFRSMLNDSSEIVFHQLEKFTDAVIMTNITDFADRLDDLKGGFSDVKHSTNSLRVYASELNDATRKVKIDLLHTLQVCENSSFRAQCAEIKDKVSKLNTNIDFNGLPDISEQIQQLDSYNEQITKLHRSIAEAESQLSMVESKIRAPIEGILKKVNATIKTTNHTIGQQFSSVKSSIGDVLMKMDDMQDQVHTFKRYIGEYSKYQYYAGIGISCLLLLISLCIALGLICGICGKRPDVYGDDCCNKGAGSRFLICGVMLMFICGLVFSLLVLPSFLLGIASQRIVCDSIRQPENSHTLRLLDELLAERNRYWNGSVPAFLEDIRDNRTLYETFRLADKVDVNKIRRYVKDYNATLADLHEQMNKASENLKSIQIDEAVEPLKQLAGLHMEVDFQKFEDELNNSNFTTITFTSLSDQLESLIEKTRNETNLQSSLKLSKLHIDAYQEKIVEPMIKTATGLIKRCEKLKADVSFENATFSDEVFKLANHLSGAQESLRNGKTRLDEITKVFAQQMLLRVEGYINRTISKIETVGHTGPLGQILNGTLTAGCDKILLPFNGFWFGLFWSVIVFIPTIIISVKLATLYQKFSPYSGHLIETEYLYDAYTDRESIPLNSRGGKPGKKKKKGKRVYEERAAVPGAGGDMVTREYPQGASHQDARYSDMAPKHWEEFPAGGPPQYQRAPTEYERPPPYYYPAGER